MSILDNMELSALDAEFNSIDFVDSYESLIWSERYNDIGDFEIYGLQNDQLRNVADNATYVFNSATSTFMVVENPGNDYDNEDGTKIKISGRAGESLLDRRIILKTTTVLTNEAAGIKFATIICDLVSAAFALNNPNSPRHWSRLEVIDETPSTSSKLPMNVPIQFDIGENLLDVVIEICEWAKLGFKCVLDPITRKVKFIVYEGVNRTSHGTGRVVFSDQFDNLVTASDNEERANQKNTPLVVGNATNPDTDEPILPTLVEDPNIKGLDRREMYYKADQDPVVYFNDGTERAMTNAEYVQALTEAGKLELNNVLHKIHRNYQGEIIETEEYTYGQHFSLGDVVVLQALQRWTRDARISGIVFSEDESSGKTLEPSFSYTV